MNIRKETNPGPANEVRLAESEVAAASDDRASRKPTLAQNVIVTIKVLVGFGVLGAALWGIDQWASAR